MKSQVTTRQKELLAVIYDFIKDTGYPPSFEEMRENLGVSSNQSVIDLLGKLEKADFLKRNGRSARGVVVTHLGLEVLGKQMFPVVGVSAAGPAIESFLETDFKWIEVPSSVLPNEKIKKNEDVFVIQVAGDSMINAGINNNDMLLVKRAQEFSSGDIVVARIDEGTTVKRFIVEGGRQYLKPENPAYQNIPIIPEEVLFEGKVILNLSKLN